MTAPARVAAEVRLEVLASWARSVIRGTTWCRNPFWAAANLVPVTSSCTHWLFDADETYTRPPVQTWVVAPSRRSPGCRMQRIAHRHSGHKFPAARQPCKCSLNICSQRVHTVTTYAPATTHAQLADQQLGMTKDWVGAAELALRDQACRLRVGSPHHTLHPDWGDRMHRGQ